MIMAKNMIASLVVVVFITVVFAGSSLLLRIASIGIILRHMGLQLQKLSSNHQLLFKNVVLISLCVLVLISKGFFSVCNIAPPGTTAAEALI